MVGNKRLRWLQLALLTIMDDAMDIDDPVVDNPPKIARTIKTSKLKSQYSFNQLQHGRDPQRIAQPRVLSSTAQESRSIKRLSTASYDTNDEKNNARSSGTATQPTESGGSNPMSAIDLGDYDGGLEAENLVRGEIVYGEAAKSLALNSSQSR